MEAEFKITQIIISTTCMKTKRPELEQGQTTSVATGISEGITKSDK